MRGLKISPSLATKPGYNTYSTQPPFALGDKVNTLLSSITLDKHGFLKNRQAWTSELATVFATEEGITLQDEHWEVIYLLREYFEEFDASPANRALVKYVKLKLGPSKGSSIYLMSLFPGSPARVGSRIAGLPKPKNCL
jgi:tRNA 2-thiouridine synthesizing protein E